MLAAHRALQNRFVSCYPFERLRQPRTHHTEEESSMKLSRHFVNADKRGRHPRPKLETSVSKISPKTSSKYFHQDFQNILAGSCQPMIFTDKLEVDFEELEMKKSLARTSESYCGTQLRYIVRRKRLLAMSNIKNLHFSVGYGKH